MENQNLSETQSLSEFIQYSLSTDPILEHTNSDNNNIAVDVMGVARANNSVEVKKRARKRTKKCDANGDNMSAQSLISNGRPRGSRQQRILASVETAENCLTPHVVIVDRGEDVVSKILSFITRGNEVVCILSVLGSASSVIINQPGACGGNMKYEGWFTIISLSGSYIYTSGAGGALSKNGKLSVSLANPDGSLLGGGLGSSMIAATPVQLVIGTFKQKISKRKNRRLSSGSSNASLIEVGLGSQTLQPMTN